MLGRILVVDDEPAVNLLMRQIFRKEIRAGELALVFAEEGYEALDLLEADRAIDVILSDIHMPGMSGFELLRVAGQRYPHIKAILVTAYSDARKRRLASEQGVFEFINKPVDPDSMRVVVKKALAASRRDRNAAVDCGTK